MEIPHRLSRFQQRIAQSYRRMTSIGPKSRYGRQHPLIVLSSPLLSSSFPSCLCGFELHLSCMPSSGESILPGRTGLRSHHPPLPASRVQLGVLCPRKMRFGYLIPRPCRPRASHARHSCRQLNHRSQRRSSELSLNRSHRGRGRYRCLQPQPSGRFHSDR